MHIARALWVPLCRGPDISENTFTGVLPNFWLLHSFCLLSSAATSEPLGGMSTPQSLILCYKSSVFLLISISCKQKLLSLEQVFGVTNCFLVGFKTQNSCLMLLKGPKNSQLPRPPALKEKPILLFSSMGIERTASWVLTTLLMVQCISFQSLCYCFLFRNYHSTPFPVVCLLPERPQLCRSWPFLHIPHSLLE